MGRRPIDAAGDGALRCLRARGPPQGGTGSHQTLVATGLGSMRAGGPARLLAAHPTAARCRPPTPASSAAILRMPARRSLAPSWSRSAVCEGKLAPRPPGLPAGWAATSQLGDALGVVQLGLALGAGGLCGVRIRLGSPTVVLAVPRPAEGKLVDQSRDLEQALDGAFAGSQP